MTGQPSEQDLADVVHRLTAYERPSASAGERRAAEEIAARLRDLGLPAAVQEERAHGTYWWPLGLLSLLGVVAAWVPSRLLALVSAAGVWNDLDALRFWHRRLLPQRSTWNVVGEAGEREAPRTIVLVSHHDAAHGGLVFDPALARLVARFAPQVIERARSWPRILRLVLAGPLLTLVGARRAGGLLSLFSALVFLDIGLRRVVPGANDNLSAVAALLAVAERLAAEPVSGARVLLVSTGSEESFEEGMLGFVARHRAELDPARTSVIVMDTVGSPRLVLVEGEGMLRGRAYDAGLKDEIAAAAEEVGVPILREHWLSFGSDALVALNRGIPCALVASFDDLKLPANYHSPTDTADRVDYSTVADCVRVVEASVRRLAAAA
jgi:hypothetical protein